MEKCIIALASYSFKNNDILYNLNQIEIAMSKACGKADLLCFGEAFLQGFDAFSWNYETDKDIAISQSDTIFQKLCSLTVKYGVDLLLGYLEREDDKIFSSCAVIENGNILHNYRRISVGWKEYWHTDRHYCEGTETADFIYKGKNFRIALCGDLWEFPEKFKTNATLLWPVYVNFELSEWEHYEAEYAEQANLAAKNTLMVNSVSKNPDSHGGAFYFVNGKTHKKLEFDVEDILYIK